MIGRKNQLNVFEFLSVQEIYIEENDKIALSVIRVTPFPV